MDDKAKIEFVDLFALFYEKFFDSSAEAIEILAKAQKEYKKEYESIKDFNENPTMIDELIDNLPDEKQAVLLKILLKAGRFGKKISNLFESSAEDKEELANELKKFSKELKKELKA